MEDQNQKQIQCLTGLLGSEESAKLWHQRSQEAIKAVSGQPYRSPAEAMEQARRLRESGLRRFAKGRSKTAGSS